MSRGFDLTRLSVELEQRMSKHTRVWESWMHCEGLSRLETSYLGQAYVLAKSRACREVLRGNPIPSKPTARQRELGMTPERYRSLYSLLLEGIEPELDGLLDALRPALERYAPGRLAAERGY